MGDLTSCQYLLEKMKVKSKVDHFPAEIFTLQTDVQALSTFEGKRGNEVQVFSFASVRSLTFDLRVRKANASSLFNFRNEPP